MVVFLMAECFCIKNVEIAKGYGLGVVSKGWDSYDADVPNSISIDNAIFVLEFFHGDVGLPCSRDVFMSVEGGVEIVFPSDNYLGVECLNDGSVYVGCIDKGGDIHNDGFDVFCVDDLKSLGDILLGFSNV